VIVVSDATPLIALAKLHHLALLRELFGNLYIPQAVYDEVTVSAPARAGANAVRRADWIQARDPVDKSRVAYLRADLDPGEAEALVLVEELAADWVLIDEIKARLTAESLGIKYIGTVGLLLLAKQRGYGSAIRPLLVHCALANFTSVTVSTTVFYARLGNSNIPVMLASRLSRGSP